jgi:hypothetical protein
LSWLHCSLAPIGRAYSANGDGIVHIGTNPKARRAAINEVMGHP